MTLTFIVAASLLCMALMLFTARGPSLVGRTVELLEREIVPVDITAFQNLIDPGEQEFLRFSLPTKIYRRLQRERILVCIAYVHCCARNAAVLIRLGEIAGENPNPEIRATGKQLTRQALRMRVFAIGAVPKFYFWWMFPDAELSLLAVCNKYKGMVGAAGTLFHLQDSIFIPGMLREL
jgi:hypothetical protein